MAIVIPKKIEITHGYRITNFKKFQESLKVIRDQIQKNAEPELETQFAQLFLSEILKSKTIVGLNLREEYKKLSDYNDKIRKSLVNVYGNTNNYMESSYDLSLNLFENEYVIFFTNSRSSDYLRYLKGCEPYVYVEGVSQDTERHAAWEHCKNLLSADEYDFIEIYHEETPSFETVLRKLIEYPKELYYEVLALIFDHEDPEDVYVDDTLTESEQRYKFIHDKAEHYYTYIQAYIDELED